MPLGVKMTFISIGVIVSVVAIANCSNNNKVMDDNQGEKIVPAKPIEDVLSEHTDELMDIDGVVGTAQGLCDGKPCIKVFVAKKTPELDKKIPDVLEGYPVSVEEVGEIKALPEEQ